MINNVIDGFKFRDALGAAYSYLKTNQEIINDLNVFPVPDGDTGTNMCLTMESAYKKTLDVLDNSVAAVAKAASMGSLMGARGNSGVILSQIFRGFYEGVKNNDHMDTYVLARGLFEAAQVAYKAVMKPTEGTILTVARETGDFARNNYSRTESLTDFLNMIIKSANESLQRTPDLLPVLKQAGVVDAGGQGFVTLLTGAFKYANGEQFDVSDIQNKKVSEIVTKSSEEKIEFGYCTEFMVVTDDMSGVDFLRNKLADLGDCLLVVGAEEIIKVHVHTNNPGKALEFGLQLGHLKDLKIENMRYQHEEKLLKDELKNANLTKTERKKYGVIAVSMGEGISRYLKDLGVDEIITGGQTMNPSTEDILEAMDKLNADNIIIFPNNKNIILAAEQAQKLSKTISAVIESKSIPECISAMMNFDVESDFDANVKNMNQSLSYVKTGQVTFAVRDTVVDGLEIKQDDYIGISGKKIVASTSDLQNSTLALIDDMIDDESSLITLFYGEKVTKEDAQGISEILSERYPNVDVEIIEGAQPIYFYIISVE